MKILFKIQRKIYILIKKVLWLLRYGSRFKYGQHFNFRNNTTILIEEGGYIELGSNCFLNNGTSITSMIGIVIGNNCIFGENVKIYDHNHVFKDINKPIREQGFSLKPISIGNNCWIGSNAVILRGVNIGDNCVIGAGCVISEDIPINSIVRFNCNNLLIEHRK